MRHMGNRTLKVIKKDLIAKVLGNKETHIKDYNEAVNAYKAEAARQLAEQQQALTNGSLNIEIRLISPVDKRENYDKIVEMFNWEISSEVELSQDEFHEYVLDENPVMIQTRLSNSSYKSKSL